MKALVTGASKGIGCALVRELIATGHEVWGVARNQEALAALAEELGEKFHYTIADLATAQGVDSVTDALNSASFYPKHIYLIAGAYCTDDATFSTQEHQNAMLNVNFNGPVWLFEALMKRKKHPEHVIVLSSIFALLGDDLNPAYALAKEQLANYFIKANTQLGLNTKVVYLGPVNTAINRYAKRKKSLLAIEPGQVALYLRQLPKKKGTTHIYPFSTVLFYQIFRYLPKSIYNTVMNKARR